MAELKKLIMIGSTEAGKTTLSNCLIYDQPRALKTQAIHRIGSIIDTPGEYIENLRFYHALIISSYDAEVVILVYDPTDPHSFFPPNFTSAFTKEVIGVITKIDLVSDTSKAKDSLKLAGVKKIFEVSCNTGDGIEALKRYLSK